MFHLDNCKKSESQGKKRKHSYEKMFELSAINRFIIFLACFISISMQVTAQNYVLITTSTKLYCAKAPSTNSFDLNAIEREDPYFEIIYEELNSTNNWITDIYYNKKSNEIYLNSYDSNALSSDIIALRYDNDAKKWTKNVLFKNQLNCLGNLT